MLWAGGSSPDRQARVRPEIHRVAEIGDAQPEGGGRAGMGRGRGVIRVIVGALLLGGCAQFYWSKPNGTAEQFDRASPECAREAGTNPTAAAHGIVDERIYRACLSALGWRREKQWDPPSPGGVRGIEEGRPVTRNNPRPGARRPGEGRPPRSASTSVAGPGVAWGMLAR